MSDTLTRTALIKGKPAKRVFYCVVLEPDTEDLQKDVIDAEEIEKVAWQYAVDSRFLSTAHQKRPDGSLVPAPAEVVETFLAPVDYEIDGELIRKGSWVMGIRVNDEEVWNNVESGDIDGVSIGGTGIRTPV